MLVVPYEPSSQACDQQNANVHSIKYIGSWADSNLASCVRSPIMRTSGASGTRAHAQGVNFLLTSLNGSSANSNTPLFWSLYVKGKQFGHLQAHVSLQIERLAGARVNVITTSCVQPLRA